MNKFQKKKFQIFLFTFLILLIYFFLSHKSNNSKTIFRKTEFTNFLDQICQESTENLIPLYAKISFPYLGNQLSSFSKALINYLLTGDKKYLTHDYLTRISRYISILLLLIIIIITYIICLFCFCFPHCCCKQKGKGNCLRYFSILITLIMSGSLITSSYYGMKMEYKIINSVNGFSCSVLKFISNVYYGDNCKEKPIWSGFFNLINSISDIQNIINNINYYNNVFINDIEKVKENDFYNLISKKDIFINNEIERFNNLNITISNPYPNDNSSIIIDFMKNISNKIESNFKDYENYINEPYSILKSAIPFYKDIKINENNIIKALNNSLEKILIFRKTFSYFYYDANDKLTYYYNMFMKYGNKLFSFLFVYFMCIGIGNIFSIFIFVTLDFKIIRIPIFFFWNIQNIVMIITFIFGLIFNLLYLEGKDGRDIISYSLTEHNLNRDGIIFKGEGKKYLNTCFNNFNGDLQNDLELNNQELLIINDLYNYFHLIKKNFDLTKELKYINYEIGYFEKYLENIENSYFYINDTKNNLKNILKELRKYTDGGFEGNYQNNNKIYDVWVFNINNCPNGYKYISLNNNYYPNKKNCLLLTERYSFPFNYSRILIKGDYENLDFAFKSFYNKLNLYYENINNTIITKILPIFKEYKNNLTKIKDIIHMNYKNIYLNISNFQKYSKYINENDSFFSFVNCRFMRRDINIFFSQMDKLGLNSANFSSIIYTISFSLMFFNFFFFFIIMRYRKEKIKIDVDDIVIENNNPEKEIPISESQSENKISDLINNQNKISFN